MRNWSSNWRSARRATRSSTSSLVARRVWSASRRFTRTIRRSSSSSSQVSIKLGASHYLVKPSNTDDIEAAFDRTEGSVDTELSERPTSIKTLEWERIHTTLAETDFNISETARRLGMHRRTLARKLEKRPVK
jgi:ActR/RegA family two-component response regulator